MIDACFSTLRGLMTRPDYVCRMVDEMKRWLANCSKDFKKFLICAIFSKNGLFKGKIGRFADYKVIAEILGYDIISPWMSPPLGIAGSIVIERQ